MYRAVKLVLSIRIVLILSYLVAVALLYCSPLQAQSDWRIQINANFAGCVDQGDLTIASQDSAATGYDSFDQPHPPALPSRYMDLYTQHDQNEAGWGNQPFAITEYISESIPSLDQANYHFPFYLRTDQNGNVNLSWNVIDDEDLSGYDISLHDLQTSTVVDMRQTLTIIIDVTAGILLKLT